MQASLNDAGKRRTQHDTSERVPGNLQAILLLLPMSLAVMGIVVLIPVLPQLMAAFADVPNYRYLVQGGVLTMPALCVMVFAPLAGWLCDRFQRRSLLIVFMFIYACIGVAPVFLSNLYAIIATRIGVGLCESVILTSSTTLISDYFTGTVRDKWLASQTAVSSVSSLILIFVGGMLGGAYGWRGPFAIYLVGLLPAIGIWRFTWKVRATDRGPIGVGAPPLNRSAEVSWRRVTGICAITLFASLMFFTVQTQCSLALNAFGIDDPARLGLLTAVTSLGVPAGTLIFRAVVRTPVHILLLLEFATIATGFIWMGRAPDPTTFVLAAMLNQLGCGMILPTLLTWAMRGIPFEYRGRSNGAWQGAFAMGQFLSGLIVTRLADWMGGLQPAFQALGAVGMLAALIVLGAQFYQRATVETA